MAQPAQRHFPEDTTGSTPLVPPAARRARLFALWHQDARARSARSRIKETSPLPNEMLRLQRAAIRSLQGAPDASGVPR